jgi:hypothetical protein
LDAGVLATLVMTETEGSGVEVVMAKRLLGPAVINRADFESPGVEGREFHDDAVLCCLGFGLAASVVIDLAFGSGKEFLVVAAPSFTVFEAGNTLPIVFSHEVVLEDEKCDEGRNDINIVDDDEEDVGVVGDEDVIAAADGGNVNDEDVVDVGVDVFLILPMSGNGTPCGTLLCHA